MAELKSTGELKLDIDGQEIVLLEEDLLIDMAQMEGYVSESAIQSPLFWIPI